MSKITKQGFTSSEVEYNMTRYRERIPIKLYNEWVAALRGGKYKQAKGTLRRGDSYCCLGVLCDIAGLRGEEITASIYVYHVDGISEPIRRTSSDQVLPEVFAEQINIQSNGNFYGGIVTLEPKVFGCLGEVNDSGSFSFEDIADVIEFFFQPATETSKDNE